MSTTAVFGLCAAVVAGIGLYGLITEPHPLRKLLAFNVLGSGAFLLFERRSGGRWHLELERLGLSFAREPASASRTRAGLASTSRSNDPGVSVAGGGRR